MNAIVNSIREITEKPLIHRKIRLQTLKSIYEAVMDYNKDGESYNKLSHYDPASYEILIEGKHFQTTGFVINENLIKVVDRQINMIDNELKTLDVRIDRVIKKSKSFVDILPEGETEKPIYDKFFHKVPGTYETALEEFEAKKLAYIDQRPITVCATAIIRQITYGSPQLGAFAQLEWISGVLTDNGRKVLKDQINIVSNLKYFTLHSIVEEHLGMKVDPRIIEYAIYALRDRGLINIADLSEKKYGPDIDAIKRDGCNIKVAIRDINRTNTAQFKSDWSIRSRVLYSLIITFYRKLPTKEVYSGFIRDQEKLKLEIIDEQTFRYNISNLQNNSGYIINFETINGIEYIQLRSFAMNANHSKRFEKAIVTSSDVKQARENYAHILAEVWNSDDDKKFKSCFNSLNKTCKNNKVF